MSNHDGMNDETMKRIAESFNLGATGKFPEGKLTPHDEGEIKIAIGVEQNKVVIHFGKEVAWIGFTREQAISIAGSLIDNAAKCSAKGEKDI